MADHSISQDRPQVTSRAAALAAGLTHYYTGKPCLRGHRSTRRVDGKCMACDAENHAAIRAQDPEKHKAENAKWRSKNREYLRQRQAKYSAENPEVLVAWRAANPEKVKECRARHRAKYREEARDRTAAWREANPGRAAAASIAWAKANPDKKRAQNRNRRALQNAAEGSHGPDDIKRIAAAQNGKCACCRCKLPKQYHVDHIVPLSRGGSNWPKNLQILCKSCNCRKKDKDPMLHMQSLGYLL